MSIMSLLEDFGLDIYATRQDPDAAVEYSKLRSLGAGDIALIVNVLKWNSWNKLSRNVGCFPPPREEHEQYFHRFGILQGAAQISEEIVLPMQRYAWSLTRYPRNQECRLMRRPITITKEELLSGNPITAADTINNARDDLPQRLKEIYWDSSIFRSEKDPLKATVKVYTNNDVETYFAQHMPGKPAYERFLRAVKSGLQQGRI